MIIVSMIFGVMLSAARADIPLSERDALLAIIRYAAPEVREKWNGFPGGECGWDGIVCDADKRHVQKLFIYEAGLNRLAPEIGQLTALTALDLSANKLMELPAEIGQLPVLSVLWLDDNQLTELPPEIGRLSALTALYLENNQLTRLLAEIGRLSTLRYLSLYGNQLTDIPGEISRLTALTELGLSANKLKTLPPETGLVQKLDR